jgi:hypothetical protein
LSVLTYTYLYSRLIYPPLIPFRLGIHIIYLIYSHPIYLSSVLIYSFPIFILYLSVLTYTYLYSILISSSQISDPARSIGVDG